MNRADVSWICGFIAPRSTLLPCMPTKRMPRAAYRTYGKGRHRAGLNYGDCFSYGLAKISGQPLLFKGEDFQHTDIATVALP